MLICGHQFCYMCVKHAIMVSINKCPLCRKTIPQEVLICGKSNVKQNEYGDGIWQYESKTPGKWWYFSDLHNKDLEEGWKKFQEVEGDRITLDILGMEYEIDFKTMTQTSIVNGSIRRIRRGERGKTNDVKGVAGMVFEDCFEEKI